MDIRYLVSLGAALTLAAGSVFAMPEYEQEQQQEGTERVPTFHELDRDGDGYVGKSEASTLPCLGDNFSQLNPENEEGLTRNEFQDAIANHCR